METENIEKKIKMLFVCAANWDRSPTAAHIYKDYEGIETRSAGVSSSAYTPVTKDLVEWANVIFCMESYQKQYIVNQYPDSVADKLIVELNIPDHYEYGEPRLISLIKEKVGPLLAEYK